jgi:hypothetical protein
LIVTRSHAFGIFSFEEWIEYGPKLSFLSQGILDRPCISLLIVYGKIGAYVPLGDHDLLSEHRSPKTIRLFLEGHIGMTPQTSPTVADWMSIQLAKGVKWLRGVVPSNTWPRSRLSVKMKSGK